ncbi:extensin family protein [Sulfitobacter pacificus]|uniref:extensin-like domain-containing protein n=1 Tax=Sulfitobacter pacificus TaxID=1499314 RepID=UPI00360AB6A4
MVGTIGQTCLVETGGGLSSLRVAAHYACRTRNNQKGAKLSEHGKGRAIDISGFRLADGSEVSVLKGWNARRYSKAMRRMHKGACGPFGTVLGPKANRFHLDHFHFDTARYRSGSYCK